MARKSKYEQLSKENAALKEALAFEQHKNEDLRRTRDVLSSLVSGYASGLTLDELAQEAAKFGGMVLVSIGAAPVTSEEKVAIVQVGEGQNK